MRATCPRCRRDVLDEELDSKTLIAWCPVCDILFCCPYLGRFSDKPKLELPKNLAIRRDGDDTVLVRRFFTPTTAGYAAGCALLALYFAVPAFLYLRNGVWSDFFQENAVPVVFGLWLVYLGAAQLVNRTTIRVTPEKLVGRDGPLPWRGSRDLRRDDVDQVFTESYPAFWRLRGLPGKYKDTLLRRGTTWRYRVLALRRDGGRVTLVSGLASAGEALYLERTLEALLGLKERPVPGRIGG